MNLLKILVLDWSLMIETIRYWVVDGPMKTTTKVLIMLYDIVRNWSNALQDTRIEESWEDVKVGSK
jgi:hypothetical protein